MSFSASIKEWAPLLHVARAAVGLLPKITKGVTKAGPSTAATAPSMVIDKGTQIKNKVKKAVTKKAVDVAKDKIDQKKKQTVEQMTTAAAGIPQDTKNMGPKFTSTNVMDRRRKKKPALLKRFRAHSEEK